MIKKQIIKISFILFLVFLIVVPGGAGTVFAKDNDTTVSSSSWLMFRGNAARTGKTTLNGPPDEVEMKWRWRVAYDTDPVSASPAVSDDGTVYIGTEGGRLAAVKPGGGSGWVYNEVLGSFKASPAVDTSGNLLAVTEDGYMYYIDAFGELLWKCDFNMDILSSPVLSGGQAYVGTDEGDVKELNLDPDDSLMSQDSKKIDSWNIVNWSYATLSFDDVKSSPAFSGNTLFFGSGDYIYAINSSTGDNATSALKWKYDVGSDVVSTPAVYDGVVYVTTSRGKLYAFNDGSDNSTNDGGPSWVRNVGSGSLTSPAVSTGTDGKTYIHVGSADGRLYAYDSEGKLKWFFRTWGWGDIESSPAVDGNGDIYFGSNDGNIYALYPDGSIKWNYMTFSKVRSSPAIGPDNLLYVGCDNGYLYCIGESTKADREADIEINVTVSPDSIENNDGSQVTIIAKISAGTEGEDVELNKIASVTIDLSALNIVNFDETFTTIETVTIDEMLDDGKNEDDTASDGSYVYAFKLTDELAEIANYATGSGIYTHMIVDPLFKPLPIPDPIPDVGPVPIMVTATDVYGNRISQPVLLNVKDKKPSLVPDYTGLIYNRLDKQDLTITLQSTDVEQSISQVIPGSGSPGDILDIVVIGTNTNFRSNDSYVEVRNDNGTVVAYATDYDNIEVLGDLYLTAKLTILDTDDIDNGTLTGIWDVYVITGGIEAIGENLFTISSSSSRMAADYPESAYSRAADSCYYEISVTNESGALLDEPFRTNKTNLGTFTLENVESGIINYEVTINGDCDNSSGFKLTTEASGYGYISGEVIEGFLGTGVDNATVSAIVGLDMLSSGARTVSSGGGYYILPLAASSEPYTVLATKDLLTDIETDIMITDGEATELNFSIKPDLSCLISSLFGTSSLKTFYSFRDDVLAETRTGRNWTRLYYDHAWEVTALAMTDPEVMAKSLQTLFYAAVSIPRYMITGKAGYMLCATLNELMDLLIERGSDELKVSLESERESIFSFLRAN